jgi:hypothetical protein
MVEFMAEHIRMVIDPDKFDLAEMLRAGGAYQEDGSVDTQLFKMYSGTFVSPLVDAMGNEDIDAQQNYNHSLIYS